MCIRDSLYRDDSGCGVAAAHQLQGKELSYNNLVDLDACWDLVQEFEEPAVAIIKHTNPSGAATAANLLEAYRKALIADPVSAFGGVIGVNREIDGDTAEEMAPLFVEAIAAPAFSSDALVRFSSKKNLRLVVVQPPKTARVIRQVSGGLLLQDADRAGVSVAELKVATRRPPTEDEPVSYTHLSRAKRIFLFELEIRRYHADRILPVANQHQNALCITLQRHSRSKRDLNQFVVSRLFDISRARALINLVLAVHNKASNLGHILPIGSGIDHDSGQADRFGLRLIRDPSQKSDQNEKAVSPPDRNPVRQH